MQHTSHGKDILCRSEAIRLRDTDRKPDDTEEKIQHHDGNPEFEDTGIHPSRKIINGHRQKEQTF